MTDPNALPLYLQLSDLVLREIAMGRLVEGQRLQPERDMAAAYGVSVGTLRKALADLTQKGHLERRQGSGNYVRSTRKAGGVYGFFRLELIGGGGQPSPKGISVDLMDKPAAAPDFGPSAQGFRMRRQRALGDVPAVAEEIWIDAQWATEIALGDLDGALYHYYQTRLGLRITRAEDHVGVGAMPDWGGLMTPGAPCGFIERVAWDQNGNRAEYSRNWFDPTVAVYVSHMK
ncbi:GntR family transcriptional regulator [Oceaniglobus ichthyenteri]|uniref:GntR family transcriptional regulator n=1 Tax=Oceaniglobus ichthyenteri TaxID=2136177 RepID=UPI000D3778EA|nr:GntR family transcriptional regulator [Oceaniglobus ichthyenteri]